MICCALGPLPAGAGSGAARRPHALLTGPEARARLAAWATSRKAGHPGSPKMFPLGQFRAGGC